MTEEQEIENFTRDKARLDEHERRLETLEREQESINELTQSVKVLAVNMEHMLAEQKKQGERLDTLEREPAETAKYYRKTIISCVITAVVSAIVTALITLL